MDLVRYIHRHKYNECITMAEYKNTINFNVTNRELGVVHYSILRLIDDKDYKFPKDELKQLLKKIENIK